MCSTCVVISPSRHFCVKHHVYIIQLTYRSCFPYFFTNINRLSSVLQFLFGEATEYENTRQIQNSSKINSKEHTLIRTPTIMKNKLHYESEMTCHTLLHAFFVFLLFLMANRYMYTFVSRILLMF